MSFVTFGVALLGGLLVIWWVGGLAMRICGLLLILAGGVGLVPQQDPNAFFPLTMGLLLWLTGHWHYALRHQEYKSPLARQVFCRWAPEWLDPTAGWARPAVGRGRGGGGGRHGAA
jgi:hypothetical protein